MAVEDDLLRIFQKTENKGGPASERSLQELRDAFKKQYDPSGQLKKLGDAADDAAEGLEGVSEESKDTKKGLEDFKDSINSTIRTINGLVRSGTRVVSGMANVGNSVSSAANSLDAIPVVGDALATVFGAVASAAEQVVNSFITATGSGATFSGSILDLARNAGMAGMTMDQFGQLIKANGDGLLGLASNTAVGARRFSLLSRRILNTSDDLFALGFSTQDLNESLARYSAQQRFLGRQEQMTDQQLIAGTRRYVKDLDMLAKITGEERKEKERERDALMKDVQFRLGLAGKSEDVVRSFGNLIQSVPSKPLQDFIKDVINTGSITDEVHGQAASQMGDTFTMLQQFEQMRRNNIAISDEQMNTFLNTLSREGKEASLRLGEAGQAANREMTPGFQIVTDASMVLENGLKSAKESQDLAIKSTDDFNTRLQKAQQQIAQFGNFFQVALAQSGMLPHLLNSFSALASLTSNILMPAFKLVGNMLGALIVPVLGTLASVVTVASDYLGPVFGFLGDSMVSISKIIGTILGPAIVGAATAFVILKTTSLTLAAWQKGAAIFEKVMAGVRTVLLATSISLTAGLAGLAGAAGAALLALGPFALIGIGIAAVVVLFKKLYDAGLNLNDTFAGISDWFLNLIGKLSDEEYERNQAAREAARAKRAEERAQTSLFGNMIPNYEEMIALQQKDIDQKQQLLNYNDPVALLTGFAEQQGVADRFEQYGQRSGSEAVETAAAGRGARSSTATPRTPTSTTPANPQTRPDGGNLPAKPQYDADGNLIPIGKNKNNKPSTSTNNTTTSPVSVDEFSNLDTVGQNTSGEKLDQLNTLVSQLVGYMSETSKNTKSTADRLGNVSGDMFSGIGA